MSERMEGIDRLRGGNAERENGKDTMASYGVGATVFASPWFTFHDLEIF